MHPARPPSSGAGRTGCYAARLTGSASFVSNSRYKEVRGVDSLWETNTLLPSLIAAAVLLLILWPTRHSCKRLLQNWGLDEPTGPQAAEAVRSLRQRRILYVLLFVVLPSVTAL